MKPMLRGLIAFLIGIILVEKTGFAADLLGKEGQGIEIKKPEPSKQEGSKNVEQLLMEGTEIQGTLEKPHVVYVIPWKELSSSIDEETPLRRSFRNEILEPVDREQFQNQWGSLSRHPK
jgi:hypothetical protein